MKFKLLFYYYYFRGINIIINHEWSISTIKYCTYVQKKKLTSDLILDDVIFISL